MKALIWTTMFLCVGVFATTQSAWSWKVDDLVGADTQTYTGFDNSGFNGLGYWHEKSTYSGSWGVYTQANVAESLGIPPPVGPLWQTCDTSTRSLSGWRKLQINSEGLPPECTKSYNYACQIKVQISGHVDMDNWFPVLPLGDCYAYGWADMEVDGDGFISSSQEVETQGLPFHGEEGWDGSLEITEPIKVAIPIDIAGDEADLNGDDSETISGTKTDAVNGHHMLVTGSLTGRAKVSDGAVETSITVATQLPQFSITAN